MKYYKVVQLIDGERKSFIHPDIGPVYIENEWTSPRIKGTQLMCFSSLQSARDFAGLHVDIWECEIEEFKGTPIFLYYGNAWTNNVEVFLNNILSLKKAKKKFSDLSKFKRAPDNTVFCKRIKLTRRVSMYEEN